jgi:hypothetical protein
MRNSDAICIECLLTMKVHASSAEDECLLLLLPGFTSWYYLWFGLFVFNHNLFLFINESVFKTDIT